MIHEVWAFGQYCLPKVSNGFNQKNEVIYTNLNLKACTGHVFRYCANSMREHSLQNAFMSTVAESAQLLSKIFHISLN